MESNENIFQKKTGELDGVSSSSAAVLRWFDLVRPSGRGGLWGWLGGWPSRGWILPRLRLLWSWRVQGWCFTTVQEPFLKHRINKLRFVNIYIVIMISHEDLLDWGILDIDQWFVEWFPSHKCQKPFLFINWFCMISLLAIFLSLLLVFPTVWSTCKSRKSLGLSFSRSTFARIQRAKWWTVQWEL